MSIMWLLIHRERTELDGFAQASEYAASGDGNDRSVACGGDDEDRQDGSRVRAYRAPASPA